MANTINITIEKTIKSNDWMRVATRRAQKEAESAGHDFIGSDVYVSLPEAGRCFVKKPGEKSLVAYG